jgi:hypothetical protein
MTLTAPPGIERRRRHPNIFCFLQFVSKTRDYIGV